MVVTIPSTIAKHTRLSAAGGVASYLFLLHAQPEAVTSLSQRNINIFEYLLCDIHPRLLLLPQCHNPKRLNRVSCNCHTKTERLGLWDRLGRVAGELDCVLHLGDQIYADEDLAARYMQVVCVVAEAQH